VSRVFVTGAGGFVGSRLVGLLEANGRQVTALSRRPPREPGESSIRWVQGDVTEPDSYGSELAQADCVVHLAARLTARRLEEYELANVTGTERLVAACAARCRDLQRLVIVSTVAAMGPRRDGIRLRETDSCAPASAYGASKLAAERRALEFASRLPITILRPSFVYGPGDARGAGYLDTWFRSPPGSWTSPIRSLSLVYVDDFVRACERCLSSSVDSGTVLLIAAPASCDWADVRDAVANALAGLGSEQRIEPALADRFISRIEALDPAGRSRAEESEGRRDSLSPDASRRRMAPPPEWWGCDTSRARRYLGFEHTETLADGVRRTLESYAYAGFFDAAQWGAA
jgi:nucleoside-diphosphate-sugar epimerase